MISMYKECSHYFNENYSTIIFGIHIIMIIIIIIIIIIKFGMRFIINHQNLIMIGLFLELFQECWALLISLSFLNY